MWDDVFDAVKVPSEKIQKAYHRKHGSYHQWYYMSEQKKEDLALSQTCESGRNEVTAGMLSYELND